MGRGMLFEPVSFALLLTAVVLAIICGILAFERLWLIRKNNGSRSEKYRVSAIEF